MEARRHGQYLILWSVIDSDGENEKVVAYYKNPHKAADFALENFYSGVEMILCKPEGHVKTED